MLYAIVIALLLATTLLFLAFWIPSERAGLDKNTDNIDLQGNWKNYLAAFICATFALLILHLLFDQRAYISLHDIPIYYASLFAVSPAAQKIYRGMKNFILRR